MAILPIYLSVLAVLTKGCGAAARFACGLALAWGLGASTQMASAKTLSDAMRSYTAPDLAVGAGGIACLAWLASDRARDEVMASVRHGGKWSKSIAVSTAPGRYLAPRVVAEGDGGCFVVWAALAIPELGGNAGEDHSSDLFGRSLDSAELGSVVRLTHTPGFDAAPDLIADASGDLWLAWEAFRDGRFDIHMRKREGGSWRAPHRVTNHAASDSHPSVALDAAGQPWVAWMSRRDADPGDGNTGVYVRRLGLETGLNPTRVSASDQFGALPTLLATPTGLALVWTESSFRRRTRHDLPALLYGETVDRGYHVAWLEGDTWTEPTLSRPSPFLHERVGAIPGPAKGELWLLFDEFTDRDKRSWIPTLQRIDRTGSAQPSALSPTARSPGARIAAAASPDGAWVAYVALVERPGARPRSAIEVHHVAATSLPTRVAADDPPPQSKPARYSGAPRALRATAAAGGQRFRAYFGNLHMHSSLSRDAMELNASPDQAFRVAYDIAGLDFAALSDHAESLHQSDWGTITKYADLWNEPGRFITLPGYEWTSREYGHKNVFFPNSAQADSDALFGAGGHTPEDLWQHLNERRAITIPHHVSSGPGGNKPTDWSFRSDHFQRLVEIFQVRGNYEFDGAPYPPPTRTFTPGHSVRAALDQGQRLGIIASPDHRGGLGLAGVWATALTRDAIFEALRARRTFGTTGPQLDLFMTVNGAPQGSELPDADVVHVEAVVHSTLPGIELTLVSNGEEIARQHFPGTEARFEWTGPPPPNGTRYYYVRALQADGHLGWSSPVWVSRADDTPSRNGSHEQ